MSNKIVRINLHVEFYNKWKRKTKNEVERKKNEKAPRQFWWLRITVNVSGHWIVACMYFFRLFFFSSFPFLFFSNFYRCLFDVWPYAYMCVAFTRFGFQMQIIYSLNKKNNEAITSNSLDMYFKLYETLLFLWLSLKKIAKVMCHKSVFWSLLLRSLIGENLCLGACVLFFFNEIHLNEYYNWHIQLVNNLTPIIWLHFLNSPKFS